MVDTCGVRIGFGKHKDLLYTRVPCGYLLWMMRSKHSEADIARAELERRGTTIPTIDISGHAIDSASLRLLKIWEKRKNRKEGLCSWLRRICSEALECNTGSVIYYNDIKLVFELGEWPILKTCMYNGKKDKNSL